MKLEQRVEKESVPKALEERLLLTKAHRRVLQAIHELSPEDLSRVLIVTGEHFPSVEAVADKLGVRAKTVRSRMEEIRDIWKLPDDQPTMNGMLTEDQAQVHALAAQHRMRFDTQINDYRVDRLHLLSSEMGVGTLYTRHKAFEGERIFRKALGINDQLNSVHFQGGNLPIHMALYTKTKFERASLIGTKKDGLDTFDDQVADEIKALMELSVVDEVTGEPRKLSEKDHKNIDEYVKGTINTLNQSAVSAGHELFPLLQGIPKNVPVYFHFSYNDDANKDELLDLQLTRFRYAKKKAQEAGMRIESLSEQLRRDQITYGRHVVNLGVAEYIITSLGDEKLELSNAALRKEIRSYFESSDHTKSLRKLEKKLRKSYLKYSLEDAEENDFDRIFHSAVNRFTSSTVRTVTDLEAKIAIDEDKKDFVSDRIPAAKDEIDELRVFDAALKTEETSGHAWFTKKFAISPLEAKAMRMVIKETYRQAYTRLFDTLEDLLGYRPNFKLITDAEQSVFIPDPGFIYGKHNFSENLLYGTILTSVPRTNRQLSNEPKKETFTELTKKHEAAISARLAYGKERPQTSEEFNKYHATSFADIVWTSWGADGFRYMPKLAVAPTRVDGEYRDTVELVDYVKTPTRHDASRLSELGMKGNKGSWEIKRYAKGGPQSGNLYLNHKADGSRQVVFVDDKFYDYIADTYGEKLSRLETKHARARSSRKKEEYQHKITSLLSLVEDEFEAYHMLQAHDIHFGSQTIPGRPTNVDVMLASQTAALQTYGLSGIQVFMGTEWLHGDQAWRSYISSYEGSPSTPVTREQERKAYLDYLAADAMARGMTTQDALQFQRDMFMLMLTEDDYSRPTFRYDDQIAMFQDLQQPLVEELLTAGTLAYIGTGNHPKASTPELDEAQILGALFPRSLVRTGKVQILHANGQSFTYSPTKLPGGYPIMLTHKLWSGGTEISPLWKQALGHKENVALYVAGDRHHTGLAAQHGKFFFVDAGKQATMPYVSQIGKASSSRGTVVLGYSPQQHPFISGRFFMDNVVDTVIGWSERSEHLRTKNEAIQRRIDEMYASQRNNLYANHK